MGGLFLAQTTLIFHVLSWEGLPPVLHGMANVGLWESSDKVMTLVIFLFDFSIDFTLILFRLMRHLL